MNYTPNLGLSFENHAQFMERFRQTWNDENNQNIDTDSFYGSNLYRIVSGTFWANYKETFIEGIGTKLANEIFAKFRDEKLEIENSQSGNKFYWESIFKKHGIEYSLITPTELLSGAVGGNLHDPGINVSLSYGSGVLLVKNTLTPELIADLEKVIMPGFRFYVDSNLSQNTVQIRQPDGWYPLDYNYDNGGTPLSIQVRYSMQSRGLPPVADDFLSIIQKENHGPISMRWYINRLFPDEIYRGASGWNVVCNDGQEIYQGSYPTFWGYYAESNNFSIVEVPYESLTDMTVSPPQGPS
jgi:hypothetical protein